MLISLNIKQLLMLYVKFMPREATTLATLIHISFSSLDRIPQPILIFSANVLDNMNFNFINFLFLYDSTIISIIWILWL